MTEDEFRTGEGVEHGGFDYMAACDKTCSTVFKPEQVEVADFRSVLQRIAGFADDLNVIKKLLFRGKTREDLSLGAVDGPTLAEIVGNTGFTANDIHTLHGLVGVITEAGEMAEALLRWSEGHGFDRVNVMEENGDVLWYVVRSLRGIGLTLEQCQRANIDKLQGRHGEAFDVFRDAHRDLASEHGRLEDNFAAANGGAELDLGKFPVVKNPPKPQHSADMSDMVHRIKRETGADKVGVKGGEVTHHHKTPIGDCEGMDC